jgi:hypothetical protein
MSTNNSRSVTERGKWRTGIKINLQNAVLKEKVYLKTKEKNAWKFEGCHIFPKQSV